MMWVFGAMTTPIFSAYSCGKVTTIKQKSLARTSSSGEVFLYTHSTIQFADPSLLLLLSETPLSQQQDLRYPTLAT